MEKAATPQEKCHLCSCARNVWGSQFFRMGPELIGDIQTVPTSLTGFRRGKINHKEIPNLNKPEN